VMRGLRKQQRVERHQMESTGGRPRWVYFIPWPSL
jgi:predicted transcriptional regulator